MIFTELGSATIALAKGIDNGINDHAVHHNGIDRTGHSHNQRTEGDIGHALHIQIADLVAAEPGQNTAYHTQHQKQSSHFGDKPSQVGHAVNQNGQRDDNGQKDQLVPSGHFNRRYIHILQVGILVPHQVLGGILLYLLRVMNNIQAGHNNKRHQDNPAIPGSGEHGSHIRDGLTTPTLKGL